MSKQSLTEWYVNSGYGRYLEMVHFNHPVDWCDSTIIKSLGTTRAFLARAGKIDLMPCTKRYFRS
jgi:hypothetical protein